MKKWRVANLISNSRNHLGQAGSTLQHFGGPDNGHFLTEIGKEVRRNKFNGYTPVCQASISRRMPFQTPVASRSARQCAGQRAAISGRLADEANR
jgi:hypothetical protein